MAYVSIPQFEAYLLTEKRVSHNTFQAYKKDIEQLASFFTEHNIILHEAKSDHVKQFVHHLHARGMNARSIARKISSIKAFFLYAHEQCGLPNITENMVVPKLEKKLPRYLSEQEIQKLFAVTSIDTSDIGARNRIMLLLMYTTGVRVSELINLRTSDAHFDTRLITVQGKGGKVRMIPLHHDIIPQLKEYLNGSHERFMRKHKCSTDWLFPVFYRRKAKPITRQAFWGTLNGVCALAGIKRAISPHKLRHSLATHMLKNGMDLRSLQLLLGHERIATVQIYTHVEKDFLRKVYDKKHPRS